MKHGSRRFYYPNRLEIHLGKQDTIISHKVMTEVLVFFACVAIEDYYGTAEAWEQIDLTLAPEPIKEKLRHFFDTRSTSLADDMKQVRQMLDAWNDEQEHPSTCYCMIMRSILHKMAFQDKFIADLKKELLNL